MGYPFEIVRREVDILDHLFISKMSAPESVVYSGCMKSANDDGYRVVRNHLHMRSDLRFNGDAVSLPPNGKGTGKTFNYFVRWTDKKPRGAKFKSMNRYSAPVA